MTELRATGIHKRYGGTPVLEGVDFDLKGGEVHALLGENGAGKSTLIKALSGLIRFDEGAISVDGQSHPHWDSRTAEAAGVATVYQEVRLIPHLSVAENLLLGREPRGPLGIDWKAMRAEARAALSRVKLDVDPRAELGSLQLAERQLVAIARALEVKARFLILDEPTSSLDAAEVETLFSQLRQLRERGMGILFITHFLDQVDAIADRITVLRNGRFVGSWARESLTRRELVGHLVGRDAEELAAKERGTEIGAVALKLPTSGTSVHQGEILGLAGLLGSGRTETLLEIWKRPRQAVRRGMALIPEDRRKSSVFPGLSVGENMRIAEDAKGGWFSRRPAPDDAVWIEKLGIRPADARKPIEALSGGNQQKAILGRWMILNPKLLMLDEPTRGIDVGAKFEILRQVSALRAQGAAVILASSETAELARVCDRVLILRNGKIEHEINDPEEPDIAHALAGDGP